MSQKIEKLMEEAKTQLTAQTNYLDQIKASIGKLEIETKLTNKNIDILTGAIQAYNNVLKIQPQDIEPAGDNLKLQA